VGGDRRSSKKKKNQMEENEEVKVRLISVFCGSFIFHSNQSQSE